MLLIVAVSAVLGPTAPARAEMAPGGKRVALVIGNGQYRSVDRLPNASNDARLIGSTLQSLGFTLVNGGPQIDLDRVQLSQAVQDFGRALTGAEVGLFYYSGHGLQVQGVNWLVPVDANPARPQDLDFQMVDADLVLRQMDGAGTRLNIVLLDACRNNPFASRGLRALQAGLAEMRAPEGTLISYATQPGAVAADGDGANSPYTIALASNMKQPGLDIFRLFNRVGLQVKRETGNSQLPWVSSSPIDGDFFFAQPSTTPAPVLPPAARVAGMAPPPDPPAREPAQSEPAQPAQPAPTGIAERLRVLAMAGSCAVLDAHQNGRETVITGLAASGANLDGLPRPAGPGHGLRSMRSEVEMLPEFTCAVLTALSRPVRQAREGGAGAMLVLPRRTYDSSEHVSVLVRGGVASPIGLDIYLPDGTVQHVQPDHITAERGDARVSLPLATGRPDGERLLAVMLGAGKLLSKARPQVERTDDYLAAVSAALTLDPSMRADLAAYSVHGVQPGPTRAATGPARPGPQVGGGSGRCARILEQAQLGESLPEADRVKLATQCR